MTPGRRQTPPQVAAWRAVTVAITLLILLLAVLGTAGLGPLGPVLGPLLQFKGTG